MTNYYKLVLYPSGRIVDREYAGLNAARKASIRFIKDKKCSQTNIYPDDVILSDYKLVGGVFIHHGKPVYRREPHPHKNVDYALWELKNDGSTGARLG